MALAKEQWFSDAVRFLQISHSIAFDLEDLDTDDEDLGFEGEGFLSRFRFQRIEKSEKKVEDAAALIAEDCQYGRCMIWEGSIPAATQSEIDANPSIVVATLEVEYTIHSYAYSWWQDADLPSNVKGMTGGMGISKSTSGTFADLDNTGISYYTNAFGDVPLFYDRGSSGSDYAIDSQSSIVTEVADMIHSSLPPEDQDNVFPFI